MRVPVLFGVPSLANSAAAHGHDVFHRAERLDVVDDGRAHAEPEHGREIRRLDARVGPLALERFDQAGFLAADVSAGAAMHVNVKVVTAAENVLAEEILSRGPPSARGSGCLAPSANLTADVDVGQLHVVREAGDDHALESTGADPCR